MALPAFCGRGQCFYRARCFVRSVERLQAVLRSLPAQLGKRVAVPPFGVGGVAVVGGGAVVGGS
jgi:hypothetical protein